jgi:hypothetical protein
MMFDVHARKKVFFNSLEPTFFFFLVGGSYELKYLIWQCILLNLVENKAHSHVSVTPTSPFTLMGA